MEERVEYEEVEECNHSYERRCYTSMLTSYSPVQEEDCRENFVKECVIENKKAAENVTVTMCKRPLVKNCSSEFGDKVCSTHYETQCITKHQKHLVRDFEYEFILDVLTPPPQHLTIFTF